MIEHDTYFMQRAIELADKGRYTTSPNPRVGCVLVKGDEIIGEGYHAFAGEGHAEVNAINNARECGYDIAGATAYVTLEPCSHTGKTPPCCESLITADVDRVVVAMIDPNPLVAGNGIAKLRSANIKVDVGLLEQESRELNPGFIKRMETGMPLVRLKLAMSLDGRTAMASGESQWITGDQARADVQRLRARSCAIVTGVDTVIQDDASLTVRADEMGVDNDISLLAAKDQPLRVILDSSLRTSVESKILSQPGSTIILTAIQNQAAYEDLIAAGAEVIFAANGDSQVDLNQLLTILAEKQCNEILVEAGATLAGAMIANELVDELVIYMAPTLLGSSAKPLFALELELMSQQQRLHVKSITPVGDDWRIQANVLYK